MLRSILIVAVLMFSSYAIAHDSWISKGGYKSPPGATNPGEWCCGQGDCGVYLPDVPGKESKIKITAKGYELDAYFQIGNGRGAVIYQAVETVPFSDAIPSPDGAYWRCKAPSGARRCFFAPPPNG